MIEAAGLSNPLRGFSIPLPRFALRCEVALPEGYAAIPSMAAARCAYGSVDVATTLTVPGGDGRKMAMIEAAGLSNPRRGFSIPLPRTSPFVAKWRSQRDPNPRTSLERAVS